MKTSLLVFPFLAVFALTAATALADSTIDPTDKYAYGANIGWTNWKHDQPSAPEGAVIGLSYCSGHIYGANVGWIDLGDGTPDDGIAYSNGSATDYGVNIGSINTFANEATLIGNAYGANIGWITFEQTHGQPKIDLLTGEFSGHAYSANCGWINLGNGTEAALTTATLDQGDDTDADMIPDWWELQRVTAAGLMPIDLTHLSKTTDSDGDGETDLEEFAADTDPFESGDVLSIEVWTATPGAIPAEDTISLFWTTKSTRLYDVQIAGPPSLIFADFPDPSFQNLPGIDGLLGDTVLFNLTVTPTLYVRIKAKPPLGP